MKRTMLLTLALSLLATSADAQRTLVQLPNDDAYLINKTQMNGGREERWNIEYRPGDSFSANVLYDGGPDTAFVYCDDRGLSETGDMIRLYCWARSFGETSWNELGEIPPFPADFFGVGDQVLLPGDRTYLNQEAMDADCNTLRNRMMGITMRRWHACVDKNVEAEGATVYGTCETEALQKQVQLSLQMTAMGCFPTAGGAFTSEALDRIQNAAAADKSFRPFGKVIFLSSSSYNGNLGGLQGADDKCQALAAGAGLAGTFKAWLSDGTTSAEDRLTHSDTPYELIDGTRIADDWDDLTDGSLQAPINLDDQGIVFPGALLVWTGTQSNGSAEFNHCNGFNVDVSGETGAAGLTDETNLDWTNGASRSCSQQASLYCIEQ